MIIFTYVTLSFRFFTNNDYRFCLNTEGGPGLHTNAMHILHTLALSWGLGPVSSLRPSGCHSPPSLSRRRGPRAAPHPSTRWWRSPSCILLETAKTLSVILNRQEYPPHTWEFISLWAQSLKVDMVAISLVLCVEETPAGRKLWLLGSPASCRQIGLSDDTGAESVPVMVRRPGAHSMLSLSWSSLNVTAGHIIYHTWTTICQDIILFRICKLTRSITAVGKIYWAASNIV
jgi:hypothetical protein